MGREQSENSDKVILYRYPIQLGAETDDFECAYSDWVKGANACGQYPDTSIEVLTDLAIGDGSDPLLYIGMDDETTRFIGFFISFVEKCGGLDVLKVPALNWKKSATDVQEEEFLNAVHRYAAARECKRVFIHALPFQSRLRKAMARRNALVAQWVYNCEVK
jgi:hypothetical protein